MSSDEEIMDDLNGTSFDGVKTSLKDRSKVLYSLFLCGFNWKFHFWLFWEIFWFGVVFDSGRKWLKRKRCFRNKRLNPRRYCPNKPLRSPNGPKSMNNSSKRCLSIWTHTCPICFCVYDNNIKYEGSPTRGRGCQPYASVVSGCCVRSIVAYQK